MSEQPPADPPMPPADAEREPDTETVRVPLETPPSPPAPTTVPSAPLARPWGVPTPGPQPATPGGPTVAWVTATKPSREVPGAPGLVFADTASRLVAYIIDGVVLVIVAGIVVGLGAAFAGASDQRVPNRTATNIVSSLVIVTSLLYSAVFWTGGRRATPGQMLFGIQVGNAFDGQPLTAIQAVRRWIGLGWFF